MARTANPYTKVLKRLSKLQDKANKLNAEIAAVTSMVEQQSKMLSTPKVISVAKKASASNHTKAEKPGKAKSKNPLKGEALIAKEGSISKKPSIATKQVSGKAPNARKIPTLPDGRPDYLATLNWDNETVPPKPKAKKSTKAKAPKA